MLAGVIRPEAGSSGMGEEERTHNVKRSLQEKESGKIEQNPGVGASGLG